MKQPLTARVQRAHDIRLVVCMAIVSILSFCVMVTSELGGAAAGSWSWLIFLYVVLCPISIAELYFTYSFCRWHNRWHRTLHESGGEQGEPSAFSLVTSKIAGWALFILMQAYAHLPTILSLLLWL